MISSVFPVAHHNVVSRLIMKGRDIEPYAGMWIRQWWLNLSMRALQVQRCGIIRAVPESIVKVNDLLAGFDDDEDE